MTNPYQEYRDARGNPVNLGILSFTAPDDPDLKQIRVYLKSAGPVYTVLAQTHIHGLGGYVEGWFPMLCAVHGEEYAVDFLRADGSATAKVDCETYFPPIPDTVKVWTNMARIHTEFLRRTFLVFRQTGERSILLRRKIRGQRCICYDVISREASATCDTCYGIGFVSGYDVFPRILMRFHPQGNRLSYTEVGLVLDSQNRGSTPIVPILADGDVIVRLVPGGLVRAYEINNPTRAAMEGPGGIPTIQEFSLQALELQLPVYKAISDLIPSAKLPPETRRPVGIPEQ